MAESNKKGYCRKIKNDKENEHEKERIALFMGLAVQICVGGIFVGYGKKLFATEK